MPFSNLARITSALSLLPASLAAAQDTSPTAAMACSSPESPLVAVTVPPGVTREAFEPQARSAFPAGTRIALLPAGTLPALRNTDEVQQRIFQVLDSALARVPLQEGHTVLVGMDSAGRVGQVVPATQDSALDASLTAAWREARFEPLRAGGCTLAGWFHVPAVFTSDSLLARLDARHPPVQAPDVLPLLPGLEREPITLSDAVDEASLLTALRGLPSSREELVFDVTWTAAGAPDSVRYQGRGPVLPGLADAVTGALRRLPPERSPERMTLVVTPGAEAAVRYAAVTDPPRLRNREQMSELIGREMSSVLGPHPSTSATVEVEMVVMTSGEPAGFRVVSRRGDDGSFEAAALRVARRMRFDPAKVAGRPVNAIVRIPITFQLSSHAAGRATGIRVADPGQAPYFPPPRLRHR